MAAAIPFHGTRQELMNRLNMLPRILAGKAADPWGIVEGLSLRVGNVLLMHIKLAFETKSRGGVGSDGIKWPPLKRETIAQRRTTAGERRALGISGKRERGLLTPAQNKRWRFLFATRKNWFMTKFGMGDAAASGRAAQYAWATLKNEGAKTKLDVLGSRQVDILQDTGELFKSFSPGIGANRSGADGQILKFGPGYVTVGTNKKWWHHLGIPGRLPARNFWPPDGKLPTEWTDDMADALQRGLAEVAILLLVRAA
jgi:hypothetical protein